LAEFFIIIVFLIILIILIFSWGLGGRFREGLLNLRKDDFLVVLLDGELNRAGSLKRHGVITR